MSPALASKTFDPLLVTSLTIAFILYLDPLHYVDWQYHLFQFLTVKGYSLWFSVASVLPLTAVQCAWSTSQYHPSPLTEMISLGCPPWVSPLALTQPCFCISLRLNIIRYSCRTTFSSPTNWVTYSITVSILSCCNWKKFALKYQRRPWCHIKVQINWLFLPLGLVDLDIEWGQLWLHINIILFSPSMSPLFDSASHSLPQKPLLKWDFSLLGGVSTECATFWHLTHYLWGCTGTGHIGLWLWHWPR